MMSMLWVVLFVALAGTECGYGLPVRPTPQDYPHDGQDWTLEGGLYTAIPALALIVTAAVLVFGCTWCYRHKDCKPNEGTDNQLFTPSASHLHTASRVLPPDSGFSEPVNNNISEDNNNGPISLREMQNIANNNATAYIVSENEERNNRYSRESIVEFEPLPAPFIDDDPLEHCADWFGDDDFPRSNLQYLRELGRGWFGRVVVGEINVAGASTTVAVKILNQNVTLQEKAQFLDEAKVYKNGGHENILGFIGKCLQEEPWIVILELCTVDLQQYLIENRPKMAVLNESGVPLRLMCDVSSALAYLHSRGITYGRLWGGSVQTRGEGASARAVLGRYIVSEPQHDCFAPEVRRGAVYTPSSEVWSLGSLIWEVCSWGSIPTERPSPPPELPCPYKDHLYQVMQLCWHSEPTSRPSAAQVHALISHLHSTLAAPQPRSDLYASADFEERWQRLKPNSIPKLDEHVAIVHAPSTSSASTSRFTEIDHNTLAVDSDIVVSRSSSIMSDRDPLSIQLKSESLTNLHGSLEDVRNIYLTHNETAALECHQGNILEEAREREQDRSDASVDPWVKDIMAGSQDDVSYYRDVSDVIKNLDNILNSEKTSSSESSHQASPSRDNLSLDCKKEYPLQSSLVKSPGITNFQNILDTGFGGKPSDSEPCDDEEDRDTIGTLSHSFERHTDSISQHTLENITPDTPMKDFEVTVDVEPLVTQRVVDEVDERVPEEVKQIVSENDEPIEEDTEIPKVVDSNVPKLKELCEASMPNLSKLLVRKDCQTPCDNVTDIRTDNDETKSIEHVSETITDSKPLDETEVTESVANVDQIETKIVEIILPTSVEETANSTEGADTLPSVTEELSTQDNTSNIKLESNLEDVEPYSMESENNYSKDETILVSDLVDTVTDSAKDELDNEEKIVKVDIDVDLECVPEQLPVSVQNIMGDKIEPADLKLLKKADSEIIKQVEIVPTHLPPEIVQNTDNDTTVPETDVLVDKEAVKEKHYNVDIKDSDTTLVNRSDSSHILSGVNEHSDGSTVYMDLINDSEIINNETVDTGEKLDPDFDVTTPIDENFGQDSTEYLELPSFDVKKKTYDFLHMEKTLSSKLMDCGIVASTPIASDDSAEPPVNELDNTMKEDTLLISDTKMPDNSSENKQTSAHESMSPFESPSHKSHHTDTYDENSSVVLGPFETCTELFKSKVNIDPVELPKEELLAFSSNFSEINLATPSPLRDGNFLNEVPDIIPDDSQFEDLASVSEPKLVSGEILTEDSEESGSGTQKRVSPSTPPNSPGIFLASTSQQKYLVDIDLNPEHDPEPIIDLNQIELQITSKLAMAENENNLNIEYSGPLTVEGLIEEGGAMRESDAIPETFLAGNGGSLEELSLDEECVKALRNELELKLPLAQVASIEPQCESEGEWQGELPPPPELVVNYPGALSPIAEETGQQLSAYENDTNWNQSTRTESSESYPEPCNTDSQGSATSPRTYTLPADGSRVTHRDLTMSADSLNRSPLKSHKESALSPIDDRTYNKDEEKTSRCERISQVSPFLVSPTADTSDVEATGASTLSKTTLPTDAKHSKPETQCLSKATSIDSWCSNDTLYNVEENFEDLATDPESPAPRDPDAGSCDTLTSDERRTYVVHDDSDRCDTFTPDSLSADGHTYTKPRPEPSDPDDSARNTQDLAYGTLPSGATFSTCTSEASAFDDWKRPELVRQASFLDQMNVTSPPQRAGEEDRAEHSAPRLAAEPGVRKMDSVDISCLGDESSPERQQTERRDRIDVHDSPSLNYTSMAPSVTSTPFLAADGADDAERIPMTLPDTGHASPESADAPLFRAYLPAAERSRDFDSRTVTTQESEMLLEGESKTLSGSGDRDGVSLSERPLTYSDFEDSAAFKPQDSGDRSTEASVPSFGGRPQDSSGAGDAAEQESEALLEGESGTLSANGDRDGTIERVPTYSDFENSAARQAQDVTRDRSGRREENADGTEGFHSFESSVRSRPQDLSSLIDVSRSILRSERAHSAELATRSPSPPADAAETTESPDAVPPSVTNLVESHASVAGEPSSAVLINFDVEDETEQPHSIIVTEVPANAPRLGRSRPLDLLSDTTCDSHENGGVHSPKINGDIAEQPHSLIMIEGKLPSTDVARTNGDDTITGSPKDVANGSIDSSKTVLERLTPKRVKVNGAGERYATVNFLNETFEELVESSVDDSDKLIIDEDALAMDNTEFASEIEEKMPSAVESPTQDCKTVPGSSGDESKTNGVAEEKMSAITDDFLQNEKKYATLDSYLPMLNDIRFTGPATEMSTSFQESPTSPASPECEQDKPTVSDILKEWDSDTDSHSSNSSSGEFIWKDGAGQETPLVPTTHFDHQRDSGPPTGGANEHGSGASEGSGSGDSGSGSEGDEVEFVPSSWDCLAAPSKSSLRSLEATPDSKKRVVFKRQKYHCVYEYPREACDAPHSPSYLPDLSTYCEWDAGSAEVAEQCYGQLFSSPAALAALSLRAPMAFGTDYDEDFFISSSARPFESLGIMSTTSQFFPGMHKRPLLERSISDDSPLRPSITTTMDLTTPDSGVEDITPSSTIDEEFVKNDAWKVDGSSSESTSPTSPAGESLGGLRHTRDKLKLDLPPSPHSASPKHSRVFSFTLDKPKRRETPLVMTDETPVLPPLPVEETEPPAPEPTFSTFGKSAPKSEPEQKIILTDEAEAEVETPKVVEGVKGEGTVLDSGDEDSGIESSSKATLERNGTPNVS